MQFTMRTYRLLIAPCLLLFVTTVTSLQAQSLTSASLEAEAYSALSEALRFFMREDDAVVASIIRFTKRPREFSLGCLVEHAQGSPQLRSAAADLRRKNFLKFVLEPKFDLPFPYELTDEMEQIGGARNPPPGKDRFEFMREEMAKLDKRMEERFTQVEMSAPGFSDDGQFAIVYIAVSYSGGYLVLHKKDNSWKVDTLPLCSWIS